MTDSSSQRKRSVNSFPFVSFHFLTLACVLPEIYQPLLEEIARIQAQAGLDADELSKGGRAGGAGGLGADSRNRR